MSLYPNPFESRASEHLRDTHQFVSTFSQGIIDLLPSAIWDRLLVIRSSPGAGKTSLMRIFSAETLRWIGDRYAPSDPLRRLLTRRNVLAKTGTPLKLGILLNLEGDYKSIIDLPLDELDRHRLFLRLLNARLTTSIVKWSLLVTGYRYPDDTMLFRFDSSEAETRTQIALERMGGPCGVDLLIYARETEIQLLRLLDAVLNVELNTGIEGHSGLYVLDVLEQSKIIVDNKVLELQPLLMFDDGHTLNRAQRDILLSNLRQRRDVVARWYSERFEAVSDQELLQGSGSEGRDYVEIDIDHIARKGSGRQYTSGRHNKVLTDVALRRAAPVLNNYAHESRPFFDLIDNPQDEPLLADRETIIQQLRSRVMAAAGTGGRYESWFAAAERLSGRAAAHRWREIEILIARDKNRQLELFSEVLNAGQLDERSSSALREAARLAVAKEYKLPYYGGRIDLLSLGTYNIEQFLNLCSVLFEELLLDVSLGRKPHLTVARQDELLRSASERYWVSIPRTVPNGRDVRALVAEIVKIAVFENNRPTMPYPPGVTGTALLMTERDRLLDPKFREANKASDRLFRALASAVSYNVLTADLDRSVKQNRYMVLYINRLLCPRFNLPLGRGGFRERSLRQMLEWLRDLPASGYRDPFEDEAEKSRDLWT